MLVRHSALWATVLATVFIRSRRAHTILRTGLRGDRSDLEQTVTWTIDNTNVGGDQTGSTLTLQPGSEGQDLWITDTFSFGDNYGVDNEELRSAGGAITTIA